MGIIDDCALETDWLVCCNLDSERVGAGRGGTDYQGSPARIIGTSDLMRQTWRYPAGSPGTGCLHTVGFWSLNFKCGHSGDWRHQPHAAQVFWRAERVNDTSCMQGHRKT